MAYCKCPDKHFVPILLLWGMKEGGTAMQNGGALCLFAVILYL